MKEITTLRRNLLTFQQILSTCNIKKDMTASEENMHVAVGAQRGN